jgi:hypothetical protein
VSLKAQDEGVARVASSERELSESARRSILRARQATEVLQQEGMIASPPPEGDAAS